MPAISTFNKLCRDAHVDIPPASARAQLLSDAGINAATIPANKIAERCAALLWARDSIAKDEDPDSWPTSLPISLMAVLMSLYALPPHKGHGPPPSDAIRLADIIALYNPNVAGVVNDPPPPPPDGINIARPDPPAAAGAVHLAQPAVPGAPSPPSGGALWSPTTPPTATKRKWLMHAELSTVLPPEVYSALDSSAGMDANARAKLQRTCRDTDLASVLDPTTSAAFTHQTALVLAPNSFFDPKARGIAMAGAGRCPAFSGGSFPTFTETIGRDNHLRAQRDQWTAMLPAFYGPAELSSSDVDRLWGAVTHALTNRATCSLQWGEPQVSDACRDQLLAIPAYRAAVAASITRSASSYDRATTAQIVNKTYLTFFLPFWWEHVLERGRLKLDDVEKTVKELMTSDTAPPPYVAPTPLPPVQQTTVAWPNYPPPPPPPSWLGYAPPTPTPGGHAPHSPTPRPNANPNGLLGFVGKPASPVIIGNNFGFAISAPGRNCICATSYAFPGRHHRPFECPLRYWASFGRCPGWTVSGTRIAAMWNGDDITLACQAEWRAFVPTLKPARVVGTSEAKF